MTFPFHIARLPETNLVQVVRQIFSAPVQRGAPLVQRGRVKLRRLLPVHLCAADLLGLVVLGLARKCGVLRPVGLQGHLVGGGAVFGDGVEMEQQLRITDLASKYNPWVRYLKIGTVFNYNETEEPVNKTTNTVVKALIALDSDNNEC